MIPGIDILATALGVIGSQEVEYFRNTGRTLNEAGKYVPTFALSVTIEEGSVQAIPRSNYEYMGLELSKKYVNWFVSAEVLGLERNAAGDEFVTVGGERYKIESTTDWHMQDGWVQALSVKI